MSPQEFAERVTAALAQTADDPETQHQLADTLMMEALRAAGFGEGVDMIKAAADSWWWA